MEHRVSEVDAALQGRYTLERELGRGGMATVYLAEDLRLHRRVALKVLHPELGATLGPERFQREIAIAARLTHPHILPLYDSGAAEGRLFYAMPYVEGESLRQRLRREPQLPVAETIAILTAVAGALDYAHQAGVIHRDIKPENILLATDPGGGPAQALVADFGIARAVDVAGGERLTETGLALGTPSYMSPEQAAASRQLDGRSDLYALGCVAYEMLAGVPPFTGSTAQAIMARHAVDPVPPLRTVRATVPEPVAAAIERALAKVPADRFATAKEFAEAMTAVEVPSARRLPAMPVRWLRVGLGAAVAAAAGVGAMTLHRAAPPSVLPSAATIAVLPFVSAVADTALARLGRDLAITVSASLDGVGGIATADRVRLAHETADHPITSPADAAGVARWVRARSALLGTLVGDGVKVRLDLALYDAASVVPLAQGITVVAHRDSLAALTDSVVWAVLRQIWRRGEPPTPSLAAMTTHSIPALRAFLDGEQQMEKDEWGAAELAYRSAIAADSTFWLAYFRYLFAQYWISEEIDQQFGDRLNRHREALPERDRLLVEAWSINDSLPLELEKYREITRRFPDFWLAWFILGDRLYHEGILLGNDWRDAQGALNQAVGLDPKLLPAWLHLFANSIGKDTVEASRALSRIVTLLPDVPVLHLLDAAGRAGGTITGEASRLADSVAKVTASDPTQFPASPVIFLWRGFPAAQVDVSRRVLRYGTEPRAASAHLRGTAWAWTQRGAWDSALASIHAAVEVEPNASAEGRASALTEYGLAVLGAWLGAVPPAEATARRPAARAMTAGLANGAWKSQAIAELVWLDGMLGFARGDQSAMERARMEARRSGYPDARMIDQSLAAFERALGGDRAGAGRQLASLEFHCASRWDCGATYPATPNIAVHRLAAATWLLEAGDSAQAARLLTWHEAEIGGWGWSFSYAITPLAYLMLARIEERRGDARSASEHYRQFLRRYDAPMSRQRHLVEEGRDALARLSGVRESPTPR
jgi:tRNA A-37 threonylcarbamoyl transferase component Bud32